MTVYIINVHRYSSFLSNIDWYIDSVFENKLDAWNRIEDRVLRVKSSISESVQEIRTDNSLILRFNKTDWIRYDIQEFIVHPRL